MKEPSFLPTTAEEMHERGWERPDFVYVSGDAYVDHPSFGAAIITRVLEAHGFKVAFIAQPDWNDDASIAVFGEPRLGFLVSAGNMDSMVNHYTVAKKRRHSDAYSPGGEAFLRPNHAATVYSNLIRHTYKDTPIILGGIEASLRRLAHYDYWSDRLKRSILLDSGADLVSYGMGERSIVEIAEALDSGLSVHDLTFIDGTVYKARSLEHVVDYELLPSWDAMRENPLAYAESFAIQYENSDPFTGRRLVEPYSDHEFVVQNPPQKPLDTAELDAVYRLPFTGRAHPSYDAAGGVPALSEVQFSLTANRGCFGECAFCALTFHQGRIVTARSRQSLVDEAKGLTQTPGFKGYIHDVGGPTADFMGPACAKQTTHGACKGKRCLSPHPCANLKVDHSEYVKTLRELRELPDVKKVFVRSGVRFDYVMLDEDPTFLRELVQHHVSGQLRVAPEHVSDEVLSVMGKPSHEVYEQFLQAFERENKRTGKKQYVVPYLMSSHPGSTLAAAVELAEFCRDMGFNPEQVQDFYPTPSTMATAMYFTGVDPRTMEPVYVPKDPHEKELQRALIQYRNPKNRALVIEALKKAGREDLIGDGPKCLVRPRGGNPRKAAKAGKRGSAAAKSAKAGKPKADRKADGKAEGKAAAKPAPGNRRPFAKPGKPRGGSAGPIKNPPAGKGRTRGPIPKANGHKGGIRKPR